MIKAVVIAFIILMLLPAKGNKAKDKQQHRPWYYIRYDDIRRLCYKMEIRLDHRKRDSAWFRFEGANTENRPLCVCAARITPVTPLSHPCGLGHRFWGQN